MKSFFGAKDLASKQREIDRLTREMESEAKQVQQQEKCMYKENNTVLVLNILIWITGVANMVMIGCVLYWMGRMT